MPTLSAEPAARPEPLLTVDEVTAGYGGPPIVRGASVKVGTGEVVTIVGPNGAGKSTLLRAVIGMLVPQSGTVRLGERVLTGLATERLARAGMGYVPQSAEVFGDLTVLENLRMGGYRLSRHALRARVDEVADLFPRLPEMFERRASKLSGGERKMVAMGRALMAEPKVLLLDEPTAGLSPELSSYVLENQIGALAGASCAILMVEQKALAALQVSDWGYVLVNGSVFLSSSASELLARPDLSSIFLGEISPGPAAPDTCDVAT